MRVVPTEPPAAGTYDRVLRRYDRAPNLQIRFSGYDVNLKSRAVEAHGVVAATLFFPPGKNAAAVRATKEGWKDETASFEAHLRGDPAPLGRRPSPPVAGPEARETTAKPVAPSAVRSSPDGIEPIPGLSPIDRKRKLRASSN